MIRIIFTVSLLVLTSDVTAGTSIKVLSKEESVSYISGEAITSASYHETHGLYINTSTDTGYRFVGIPKDKGFELAKKIALGKPSELVDLTSYERTR